jgi:hypothetical protein
MSAPSITGFLPTIQGVIAVAQGNPSLVTTAAMHNFVVGQEVQFQIPPPYGMRQLDGRTGYILQIPTPTTFTVTIDSTYFDSFINVIPTPPVVYDPAQVAGIGDANTGFSNPGGIPPVPNFIPGAFSAPIPT